MGLQQGSLASSGLCGAGKGLVCQRVLLSELQPLHSLKRPPTLLPRVPLGLWVWLGSCSTWLMCHGLCYSKLCLKMGIVSFGIFRHRVDRKVFSNESDSISCQSFRDQDFSWAKFNLFKFLGWSLQVGF